MAAREGWSEERFRRLALRCFRLQHAEVEPYRRYCERRRRPAPGRRPGGAPLDGDRRGREDVAVAAAESGVSRVRPPGRVGWPPADWRHDGRHQILPLLRWTDWELTPESAPGPGR